MQVLIGYDSNLYQYHLQYGVLTINEVRAKLGLPPVAWGDQAPSPVDARSPHKIPGASTGEDHHLLEKDKESSEELGKVR